MLDAALTCPADKWNALLEERCEGDIDLRREVEALLARVNTAWTYLESAGRARGGVRAEGRGESGCRA